MASGIDASEAKQEAVLILEHVSGLSATEQIVSDLTILPPEWLTQIEKILGQRHKKVPIQYALGEASFRRLKYQVEPGVLIPRPDTETLVEVMLARLDNVRQDLLIAEIGIGAGPIAISVLKERPQYRFFACDTAPKAIDVAFANAVHHGVSDRLELVCGDWQKVLPSGLDVIVSNPPYLKVGTKQALPAEIGEHEPEAALFDQDGDGLSFYRNFAAHLPGHFRDKNGFLAVEFGDAQSEAVQGIFSQNKWRDASIHLDIHGLPRVLTATVPG